MPLVLDASAAVCWAIPDERDDRAKETLARVRTDDLSAYPPCLAAGLGGSSASGFST